MTEAYIIDAVRTPRSIGKLGKGALSHLHPQHLAAAVLKALKERNQINTSEVDDVIWGCSAQFGLQGGDMGRQAALDADYDVTASGVTLDRFCGSGITATALAAAQILSGMEDLVIAGGTEMMSQQNDYLGRLMQAGLGGSMGSNARLQAKRPQSHQGVCADAIAAIEGISREDLEAFGVESQRRAAIAIAEGRFAKSTIAVTDDAGDVILDHEEYPRPSTTAETLAAMKPAFELFADMPSGEGKPTFRQLINQVYPEVDIKPIHHVGVSSGVVDGAGALLLASREYAEKQGWKPRARIVATANIGDCPTLMLNAPVPAAKKVLAKAGLTKDDIDVWEINEAFAVVAEKFIRDLGLDRAKVNPNGGSIALGHPIGATGAILIGTALDELERTGGRYGLITMCAAAGMAPAIIIEQSDVRDIEQLTRALRGFLAGGEAVTSIRPITTGFSNETYIIDGLDWILRLPPAAGAMLEGHDVVGQAEIYQELATLAEAPPVPPIVTICRDPAIIGVPFFVMERIAGESIDDMVMTPWFVDGPDALRRRVCSDWVSAYAGLSNLNPLATLGVPVSPEDDLRMWRGFAESAECPALVAMIDRLLAVPAPLSGPPALVHGDPKLSNLMWHDQRITAMLDWEMALNGEPLANLGYILFFCASEYHVASRAQKLPGMLNRDEVIALWEQVSGRSAAGILWHEIAQAGKLAGIIAEGVNMSNTGRSDDPRLETFKANIGYYLGVMAAMLDGAGL